MTREEAIKMIKAKLECMTRDVSGIDEDCNMRWCDECCLNYDQGNMGEQIEWLKMSIQALEDLESEEYERGKNSQELVLDKIRAEIKDNRDEWIKGQDPEWHTYNRCLQIIDKYKTESEDAE